MAQQYHCRGVHGVLQRLWLLFGVLVAFLLNAKFKGAHLAGMLYLPLKILHFRVECIS